jgi:hypothetical protein
LLEHGLRVVYRENLDNRSQQICCGSLNPIVEPRLKYSSRSSVKDLSSYSSASDTLCNNNTATVTLSSSEMEIDGSNSNTSEGHSRCNCGNMKTTNGPLLPMNLKQILNQNVVTRCFSCMKPIFTESWLVVFGVPGKRKSRLRNDDQNPRILEEGVDEEEERLVQYANELQISCIFCCSKNCLDILHDETTQFSSSTRIRNWPLFEFLKHEFKFKVIK